ncbi:MAG: hypothetical protein JXR70_06960 [Spirochaetales bacterium]|nr:hypothetical protein [Spirochaetales bacterium]
MQPKSPARDPWGWGKLQQTFHMGLNYPQQSDTVSEGDFLAVYDKVMLDRANMYIDEGENDLNANQIDLKAWRNFDTGTLVHNSVAYGWSCEDRVVEFNLAMETSGLFRVCQLTRDSELRIVN